MFSCFQEIYIDRMSKLGSNNTKQNLFNMIECSTYYKYHN